MILQKLTSRRPKQILNILRTRWKTFSTAVCTHDPTEIMVFVTTRCNFLCNTCPFTHASPYSPPPAVPDIDPAFFETVLDTYSGASLVGLVGGEPLLHPSLETLIHISARRKFTVNLSTNGSLLTETKIQKLLNLPLGFINISLDAESPEEYLRLRGGTPDLYLLVKKNAAALANMRVRLASPIKLLLSFVIDQTNVSRIPDMVKLTADLGFDRVFCQNVLSYQCSQITDGSGTLYDTSENRKLLSSFNLSGNVNVVLPVLVPSDYPHTVHCRHPFKMLTFDGAGNVSPCCVIPPHPRFGAISEKFSDWHTSPHLAAVRNAMLSGHPFDPICLGCWEKQSLKKPVH